MADALPPPPLLCEACPLFVPVGTLLVLPVIEAVCEGGCVGGLLKEAHGEGVAVRGGLFEAEAEAVPHRVPPPVEVELIEAGEVGVGEDCAEAEGVAAAVDVLLRLWLAVAVLLAIVPVAQLLAVPEVQEVRVGVPVAQADGVGESLPPPGVTVSGAVAGTEAVPAREGRGDTESLTLPTAVRVPRGLPEDEEDPDEVGTEEAVRSDVELTLEDPVDDLDKDLVVEAERVPVAVED